MKKTLFKLHEAAAAKARAQARRERWMTIKNSLITAAFLKKYAPLNAMTFLPSKKILQATGVVAAFLVIATFINEPLRNDLLGQLHLNEDFEFATVDSLDTNQLGDPGMRPVIFSNPLNYQKSNRFGLIEPSIAQHPVPSIAPLANQIQLDRVDSLAHDSHLLDSIANQSKVANLMADKYKVDLDVLKNYISHAVLAGKEASIDPLLIVAVMAIESNFNALVQSPAGAQGLMQVMTSIHATKFHPYGGIQAAFKPEANIRVGAYILKYFIAQAGTLHGGLQFYVGAASGGDGGYAEKVLRERSILISALGGVDRKNSDSESAQANKKSPSKQSSLKVLSDNSTDS